MNVVDRVQVPDDGQTLKIKTRFNQYLLNENLVILYYE